MLVVLEVCWTFAIYNELVLNALWSPILVHEPQGSRVVA